MLYHSTGQGQVIPTPSVKEPEGTWPITASTWYLLLGQLDVDIDRDDSNCATVRPFQTLRVTDPLQLCQRSEMLVIMAEGLKLTTVIKHHSGQVADLFEAGSISESFETGTQLFPSPLPVLKHATDPSRCCSTLCGGCHIPGMALSFWDDLLVLSLF